jgi:hypothetical protein
MPWAWCSAMIDCYMDPRWVQEQLLQPQRLSMDFGDPRSACWVAAQPSATCGDRHGPNS